MRICFITFDSLNEGVGQSQIVPLVKGLSRKGYKVTVISFEKVENSNLKLDLEQVGVNWMAFKFGESGIRGLPKRIYLMTRNLPKPDIFHCRSDLPIISLVLRMNTRPFLWDVRSLWYEQKLIIEGRTPSGLLYKLARRIERYAAKNATAINVLAEPLLGELVARNGVIPKIRTVIPTSVDLEKFGFVNPDNSVKRLLVSGTLNDFYDITTTRKILRAFKDSGFSIEWARGAESKRANLSESFIEVDIIKHSDMPLKIAQSSFGIAICRTDCLQVLKGVMPTKIAEFLSVGRPVIVSRGMGDLDRLLKESNTGIVLEEGMDVTEVVAKANHLLLDAELPKRCRKLAEDHFSMDSAIAEYSKTYKLMISKRL